MAAAAISSCNNSRVFDRFKLSNSGLLAALMNNLHYPLGIWISGLLAFHQPHKQLLILAFQQHLKAQLIIFRE
jgi:hypothetical protein